MRTYAQFCALSRSLDVVGGRWTLLIVRELLLGPRRFGDLRTGLPGIANNLLAERLRELESDGLVRRRLLPAPAAVQVYELTERGQGLDEVVFALMRWGEEYMTPRAGDFFRPEWLALVLRAYLPRRANRGDAVRARFELGETRLFLDTRDGTVRVYMDSEDDEADVVLEVEPHTLLGVASGSERFSSARRRGDIRVRGGREHVTAVRDLFDAVSPR